MKDPRRLVVIALIACSLALCAGCVRAVATPEGLDRKLDQTAYIEEGDLMALVVGTRVAYARENPDYVPLEIAIVNKGLASLNVNREYFTLVDDEGQVYPAVGGKEIGRKYNVDVDRRLSTVAAVVRGRYAGYREEPSTLTVSFDRPIQRDLHLPRFSWASDLLYFPRPADGERGRVFELVLDAPELEGRTFVRFMVAAKRGDGE